jgi:hypothetical protein
VAFHLADTGHDDAELWGAAMKAHGVDTAVRPRGCRES